MSRFLACSCLVLGLLGAAAADAGESNDFADAESYPFKVACALAPFDVSRLERPGGVERRDTPLGRAIKRIVRSFEPELGGRLRGWRVLSRRGRRVEVGSGQPPRMADIVLKRTRGRSWSFDTLWSRCRPTAVSRRGSDASWRVRRADLPLSADATRFTALVTELACANGDPPVGRVSDPIIRYGRETVGVAFFVRPLESEGDAYCEGAPPVPVEVELDRPLGDRGLLDIGAYPPRATGWPAAG